MSSKIPTLVVIAYTVFGLSMATIYPNDPKYFNGLTFLIGILLPSPIENGGRK